MQNLSSDLCTIMQFSSCPLPVVVPKREKNHCLGREKFAVRSMGERGF